MSRMTVTRLRCLGIESSLPARDTRKPDHQQSRRLTERSGSRAWRGRFDRHRRLARLTLPIWLYVSVSGVLVYVLLYHSGR